MKFGILRDKFKLKKFQSLYFVFEYWFRDIKEILAQIMRHEAAKILAELREVTAVAELDGISWCLNI